MGEPRCRRCGAPGAGSVSVASLGEPRPVAELVLCADHLLDVAVACGFEPPQPVSRYEVGEPRRGV